MGNTMTRIIYVAFLLLCLPILSGCTAPQNPTNLPVGQAKNGIESKSYLITFSPQGNDGELRARDGLSFADFMEDLRRDPPGYVNFLPAGDSFDESGLMERLHQSGLSRSSDIEVSPVTHSPKGPALTVSVTYYYYRLADCGTDLSFRKLDHIAMTSPGFGCAVEQNRMLSLARPEDWRHGRALAPSLAGPDVKAVTTWQNATPTPFPQRSN